MRTSYSIDIAETIIDVGGSWDEFALDNGGESVCERDVVGRPIWNFVTGDSTRMWLGALIQLSRLRHDKVERLYRCDSPTTRRYMTMRIVPGASGVLCIEHELLRIEEMPEPVVIRHRAANGDGAVRPRCSVCGRVRASARWNEPAPGHGDDRGVITVDYTVCLDCSYAAQGC